MEWAIWRLLIDVSGGEDGGELLEVGRVVTRTLAVSVSRLLRKCAAKTVLVSHASVIILIILSLVLRLIIAS